MKLKLLRFLPDKPFLKFAYKARTGQKLNLKDPKLFNEKLQWLKLYDRNPEYSKLVDKYEVKGIVANKLGEEYLIPTIGVWDSFDEIDFDKLPDKFVLKCTHDSGGVIVCRDKKTFNVKEAKKKIERSLKRNYYYSGREWPYKNIKPRIMCEEYVEDSNGELKDYKFFCFDGKVDCVMVVAERSTGNPKFYYFSRDWKILPYGVLSRSLPKDFTIPKPECIEEMFELSERLSRGFAHVRMDFYEVDGHIYFGEYTLYSCSGMETGFDYSSNLHLGDLINLSLVEKGEK